jgi:uncharacterized protein YndB with AHSA1/START domain
MTVVRTHKDVRTLAFTLVAEFGADVERVWQIWQDPRQLERWWGPPGWPATFDRHELVVGGQSRYHMTGPDGQKPRLWWTITAVDPPHRLEFEAGFAGEDGEPLDAARPMRMAVTIEETGAVTRMTTVTTFADVEQMEQELEMGMEEGMRQAASQIDDVIR